MIKLLSRILLCLVVLALTSCKTDNDEINEAQRVCKTNDGLAGITTSFWPGVTVRCKNGASFFVYGSNLRAANKNKQPTEKQQ